MRQIGFPNPLILRSPRFRYCSSPIHVLVTCANQTLRGGESVACVALGVVPCVPFRVRGAMAPIVAVRLLVGLQGGFP